MLRILILGLSLSLPALMHSPAFAEQKSWTGLAEPKNSKEWDRAVQLRVNANLQNIFTTSRVAGMGKAKGTVRLDMEIASDGRVTAVSVESSSGSEKLDATMLRSGNGLPQMPRFTPDMRGDSITVRLPVNIE